MRRLNLFAFVSKLVELSVTEVKSNVYGNLDEVENVEEAKEEDEARATHNDNLNYLTSDTEGVTDEKEYLEEDFKLLNVGEGELANLRILCLRRRR